MVAGLLEDSEQPVDRLGVSDVQATRWMSRYTGASRGGELGCLAKHAILPMLASIVSWSEVFADLVPREDGFGLFQAHTPKRCLHRFVSWSVRLVTLCYRISFAPRGARLF